MTNHTSFTPDFAVLVEPGYGGQEPTVTVHGELDSGTCPELVEAVERVLAAGAARKLTLDLSQMTFIDSAGTRALIILERAARDAGAALEVLPPREQVTELLRTAGFIDRVQFGSPTSRARTGFLQRTELELPRDPHSPARARGEVREGVSGCDQAVLANIVLLTSELVTNAVVHARGVGETPIGLRIVNYLDGVRVEVEDAGEGFQYAIPELPEGENGRGLFLVDRFANRWGAERVQTNAGGRFRVWFEVDWPDQESAQVA